MKERLICFDFDGVIANTFSFCLEIIRQYFPGLSEEEYRQWFEGNIAAEAQIYAASPGKEPPADWRERFWREYQTKLDLVRVAPGLVEAVKDLTKLYPLFIVSSTRSGYIEAFLEKNGLEKYFQEIWGSDVAASKTGKLRDLLANHQVKPESALYITDTTGDILEAAAAGVKSIAVTWGYHLEASLRAAGASAVVSRPQEIKAAVERLFNLATTG